MEHRSDYDTFLRSTKQGFHESTKRGDVVTLPFATEEGPLFLLVPRIGNITQKNGYPECVTGERTQIRGAM